MKQYLYACLWTLFVVGIYGGTQEYRLLSVISDKDAVQDLILCGVDVNANALTVLYDDRAAVVAQQTGMFYITPLFCAVMYGSKSQSLERYFSIITMLINAGAHDTIDVFVEGKHHETIRSFLQDVIDRINAEAAVLTEHTYSQACLKEAACLATLVYRRVFDILTVACGSQDII